MEGQRQHIRTVREFGEQRIRRRTGRASFGGKQFHHDRPFRRIERGRCGQYRKGD
jgi:hypothetical protein